MQLSMRIFVMLNLYKKRSSKTYLGLLLLLKMSICYYYLIVVFFWLIFVSFLYINSI